MLEIFNGIIRHLLTAGGGVFVSKGILDASQIDVVVGAVIAIFGVAWSVFDKRKKK